MSSFPDLNTSFPNNINTNLTTTNQDAGSKSMLDNKYPITQQFKNSDMHNSPVRFFSYDLSELRFKANAARHQSLRTRLYSNNFRTSNKLPFRIIKNTSVKPEPLGNINIKLNKEGVEMNNAIKRRKESQKQHEQIQNRIKHLQDAERRE